jgi:glycosyltransferase involved in cell wall biosynthesis
MRTPTPERHACTNELDLRTADGVERRGRIGVVPARYGPEIVGGAEIVLSKIAHGLDERGWDVEILTTAATDYFSWANDRPVGTSVEDGLTVHRFPAVVPHSSAERHALGDRIMSGEHIGLQEQQRWMNADVRVPELYHWLLRNHDRYRALLFGPYLFWPAYACSQIAPEKSVFWTCLHDEAYAYLDLFEPVLSGIAGLLLQTGPEHDLAHTVNTRLAPHAVVGCGVEVPDTYDADGFRARYGIDGPYVLYAGRREGAKGWDELLAQFADAVRRRHLPFSLVTMGAGDVIPPSDMVDRVVDVGFLPDHERDNAFAGASAYVQPSRYEAFSRTIMESWLAGVPVIGFGGSAVVADHIEKSKAGIVYDDGYELEEALVFLHEAPEQARLLGAAGREYVLSRYQWKMVLDKIEVALSTWTEAP